MTILVEVDIVKKVVGLTAAALSGLVLLHATAHAQAPAALVIDGGTLIDGNGGTPITDAIVVIEGDRITNVPRSRAGVDSRERADNPRGWHIHPPGLWDLHVSYTQVSIDASLLRGPGRRELVARNPWPLQPEIGRAAGQRHVQQGAPHVTFQD